MKAIHHDLMQEGRNVPWSKLCAVLGVPRSSAYYTAKEKTPRRLIDPGLEQRIKELIETQAAFGIRSVWAWLRFVDGLRINRWTLKARRAGQRPRVQAFRSNAEAPNQRWATDIALVHCGVDGWCAMVPVIDCCTREILGWELDQTVRAKPPSAPWKEPCSIASADFMAPYSGSPYGTTMVSSLAPASTAEPSAAMVSNRSTSHPIPRNKTAFANASFEPSVVSPWYLDKRDC